MQARKGWIWAVVLLSWSLSSGAAWAQTATCEALSGDARALAERLLQSQYAYECCDDTLAKCLEKKPECQGPKRLSDYVCRLAGEGKDAATIERSLERRALSMVRDGKAATIAHDPATVAGCPDAPVRVTLYLCLRCPYCSKLIPELHRMATRGDLATKIQIDVRIFPIKSHKDGTPVNLAAEAAARMGKFWDFTLYAYANFDSYKPERLPDWGAAIGLERAAFQSKLEDKATRDAVVAAKKEGLALGVDATPTLFINGRAYFGDNDTKTLQDVFLEEYEYVTR